MQVSQTSIPDKVADDDSEIKEDVIKEEKGLEDAFDVHTDNGSQDNKPQSKHKVSQHPHTKPQTRND